MESSRNPSQISANRPRVLVIGASSYVGAELYSAFVKAGYETHGTYNNNPLIPELAKLDISSSKAVRELISSIRPNIIVLAAAISNQAGVERDRSRADEVNVLGCKNVVDAAKELDSGVIYLSTESVYSGSEYGNLKLRAEEIVRTHRHLILQLGMCFGASPNTTNDRPHNRLLRAIRNKEPVDYDTELKFWPTYLPHLSSVLIELAERNYWNDTIPVICTPATDRYQLAKAILTPLGIEVRAVQTPGALPLSPLDTAKLQELALPLLETPKMIEKLASDLIDQS